MLGILITLAACAVFEPDEPSRNMLKTRRAVKVDETWYLTYSDAAASSLCGPNGVGNRLVDYEGSFVPGEVVTLRGLGRGKEVKGRVTDVVPGGDPAPVEIGAAKVAVWKAISSGRRCGKRQGDIVCDFWEAHGEQWTPESKCPLEVNWLDRIIEKGPSLEETVDALTLLVSGRGGALGTRLRPGCVLASGSEEQVHQVAARMVELANGDIDEVNRAVAIVDLDFLAQGRPETRKWLDQVAPASGLVEACRMAVARPPGDPE